MPKYLLQYGMYSIEEESVIIVADSYDSALIEADSILFDSTDDSRLGRTIEDIMEEEEGCDYDDACEIYDDERNDWHASELTEI